MYWFAVANNIPSDTDILFSFVEVPELAAVHQV